MRTVGPAPWDTQGQLDMGGVMDVDGETGDLTSGTDTLTSEAKYPPEAAPAPDSPSLSVQVPPSPRYLAR